MSANPHASDLRVEKTRSHAAVRLSDNDLLLGCFFVSASRPNLPGPERIGELLNAEPGFFPFELHDEGVPRTILVNRAQVLTVELAENEARQDTGYDVAIRHKVALRFSNGHRVEGTVRVYRPSDSVRLSDWARQPDQFRYIETEHVTVIVNIAHVVDACEMSS